MSPHTDYNIILTEPAQDDIEAITNYTTIKWGEAKAYDYREDLYSMLENIRQEPERGRAYYGVSKKVKGRTIGRHIIFYRLSGDTVYVSRILHDSMNHAAHL